MRYQHTKYKKSLRALLNFPITHDHLAFKNYAAKKAVEFVVVTIALYTKLMIKKNV